MGPLTGISPGAVEVIVERPEDGLSYLVESPHRQWRAERLRLEEGLVDDRDVLAPQVSHATGSL